MPGFTSHEFSLPQKPWDSNTVLVRSGIPSPPWTAHSLFVSTRALIRLSLTVRVSPTLGSRPLEVEAVALALCPFRAATGSIGQFFLACVSNFLRPLLIIWLQSHFHVLEINHSSAHASVPISVFSGLGRCNKHRGLGDSHNKRLFLTVMEAGSPGPRRRLIGFLLMAPLHTAAFSLCLLWLEVGEKTLVSSYKGTDPATGPPPP